MIEIVALAAEGAEVLGEYPRTAMRKDGKNGKTEKTTNHGENPSQDSHPSQGSADRLLPPRGDYQTLLSFQKAEVVYDITFRFAHKFLSRGDRTVD